MTIPIWLCCIIAFPAFVGTLALIRSTWLTVQALRFRKLRQHPLAMRNAPGGQPVLDECPGQCPECTTPILGIRRAAFTPDGETFQLLNVEHFACENGHHWFGKNQRVVLGRRIAARKKMPAADPVKPTPVQDDAQRLQAKVKELCAITPEVDSTKA